METLRAHLASMADCNARFARKPRRPEDVHRPVLHDARELDLILCEHHARKLTKNLTLSFECDTYQVTAPGVAGAPGATTQGDISELDRRGHFCFALTSANRLLSGCRIGTMLRSEGSRSRLAPRTPRHSSDREDREGRRGAGLGYPARGLR